MLVLAELLKSMLHCFLFFYIFFINIIFTKSLLVYEFFSKINYFKF